MSESFATYAAERQAIPRKVRFAMLRRDGFQCRYCGRRPPEVPLEPDHIIPVAVGGTNDLANLITSCRDCNRGKGDYVEDSNGEPVRIPRGRHIWRVRTWLPEGGMGFGYKRTEFLTSLEWGYLLFQLEEERSRIDVKIAQMTRLYEWRREAEAAEKEA